MNSTSSSSGDRGSPGESCRTRNYLGIPLQQQQQRQQQRQQPDVQRMLGLALSNLSRAERSAAACPLHLTNRAHRWLALSALSHLSLGRFDHYWYPTCEVVYSGDRISSSRAVVPDPPIPWGTLADLAAAGGAVTSLDIRQCQAEPLLAGVTRAATAPVLAATLAGLRCLRVTELGDEEYEHRTRPTDERPENSHRPDQLRCVGRLISSCSGLTKLVLENEHFDFPVSFHIVRDVWTAAGAPAATAAAAGAEQMEDWEAKDGDEKQEEGQHQKQQRREQGEGAGTGLAVLPQLRHLEMDGVHHLLPALCGSGAAPHLTSCKLTSCHDLEEEDLRSLAACSELQDLHLQYCHGVGRWGYGGSWAAAAFQELLRGSALTRLAVDSCGLADDQLRAVFVATQLRHLDLSGNTGRLDLPADLSSLQQLTCLDISGTGVEELPQQLDEWLPQLQVLGVENTRVAAIPQGLQRLTGLRAARSAIPSVTAVQQLVGLQQLQLHGNTLAPPHQQLSVFTALQELSISIREGGAQVTPSALPLLKALRLKANDPFRAAGQLVGPGRHLTSLGLYSTWCRVEQAASVGQLGVLPLLQQLVLSMPLSGLRAAGPWLLKQAQLTSLSLTWSPCTEQSGFWRLQRGPQPVVGSLQQLCLRRGVPQDGLPAALTQLKGLRVLRLSGPCSAQLPAWVAQLTRLSGLELSEGATPQGEDAAAAAWAVLGHMPLLRWVDAHDEVVNSNACMKQLQRDLPRLVRRVHPLVTKNFSAGWRRL